MTMDELIRIFARLGARDPEKWARSEHEEGIPQRARFLFLRQAWKLVVDENDDSWIEKDQTQSGKQPNGPGAGIAPALERLLACGASREDLTTLVRVKQWEVLSGLCYLLDDPGEVEPEAREIGWRLFQVQGDEESPTSIVGGLHESVLETEPTGREMRPRRAH